jgi:hypothetical protein
VPQVVGPLAQRRGDFGLGQRGLPGLVRGPAIDRVGEQAAGLAAEQPAIGRGAVLGDVLAEQADERRRRRDRADFLVCAVLERLGLPTVA